ncbi:MAG TPA: GGDEF domain-containing protein [Steroidobacteraceae bacterium]|nr:GGDEF domain-containing protein [Steroidobacteraceae bacterium]
MRDEIEELIRSRKITPRYQPIVDLRTRKILASEALVRAPESHALCNPLDLFAAADRAGCLAELEIACLDIVLEGAAAAGVTQRIFLNLSPAALLRPLDWAAELARLCERHRVAPEICVLELTERSLVDDYVKIRATLDQVRQLGFDFAIDDLGTGYSGLRMWSELRPDYVKIDRYFISDIDTDPVKLEFVRSIMAMARAIGSHVIAEGVERSEECRELLELDLDAAQGFLFARPGTAIRDEREVLAPLLALRPSEGGPTAHQLVVQQSPLSPDLLVRDFVKLLRAQTQCDAFPVVDPGGMPLGMIWRNTFLLRYSKPLQPELMNKRPVREVMDTTPLIVDERLRLEQVSQLVTRRARERLTEQFIIVRDGRYVGIGQTIELLERITQERVRTATYSNPLTLLPGNVPIRDTLDRWLGQHRPFVVCYVDLDNFKPFNDCYGYLKGDEVLLHVAQLLQAAAAPQVDFLGHIGGDDFVLIMRSADWAARLERLVHDFEASVRLFYSEEHRVMGGIETHDRHGQRRWFEFLTLSVAIVSTADERLSTAEEVSERLQLIKTEAKAIAGNCLLIRAGDGYIDLLGRADRRGRGEPESPESPESPAAPALLRANA